MRGKLENNNKEINETPKKFIKIEKLLIIALTILLSISIILINKSAIIEKIDQISQKYEINELNQMLEEQIEQIKEEEQNLGNEVTLETMLQALLDKGILRSIDKQEKTGILEDEEAKYEIKIKYNESNDIEIEYIQLYSQAKAEYYLYPSTYTNEEKVQILFHTNEDTKSITKPDGLIIYPKTPSTWIDYTVTQNGTYKFTIEKENGSIEEKEVIVDIIDTLPPKDIEITLEKTRTGFKIIGTTQDEEVNETSTKSGIEKYEYYVKTSSTNKYTKYETNEINYLSEETYEVYVVAYDKAGNISNQSNKETIKIEGAVEIWNEEQLRDIAKNLNRDYVLMTDIELENEWEALPTFGKEFDGNGHKITKMEIQKQSLGKQGLFTSINRTGKIKNLEIECNIVGKNETGGIAGLNQGTIENVKVKGIVTGSATYIGGIVGDNIGTIIDSYAYGTVTGQDNVGGIAGYNKGTITRSCTEGTVTGEGVVGGITGINAGIITKVHSKAEVVSRDSAGGIAGEASTGSTIDKSVSSGNIKSVYYTGGIVGQLVSSYPPNNNIKNSYSTGDLTGNRVGGIVGDARNRGIIMNTYTISTLNGNTKGGIVGVGGTNGASVQNSYWSKEKTGATNSYGTVDVTDEQMKIQETYEGWDFENIWVMKEYPELR